MFKNDAAMHVCEVNEVRRVAAPTSAAAVASGGNPSFANTANASYDVGNGVTRGSSGAVAAIVDGIRRREERGEEESSAKIMAGPPGGSGTTRCLSESFRGQALGTTQSPQPAS